MDTHITYKSLSVANVILRNITGYMHICPGVESICAQRIRQSCHLVTKTNPFSEVLCLK